MKAIINAELVLKDHYLPDAYLVMEDGKIKDFGRMKEADIPKEAEIIDAKGSFVGPGLMDIHVHAGNKIRFKDAVVPGVTAHLKQGTTTILPTLSYWFPEEVYLKAIAEIKRVMKEEYVGAAIGGVYMEGPYINHKFGANKKDLPWGKAVKREDYENIVRAVADIVKVWALAPEREGILDFVKFTKELTPSVRYTVAHSEAAPEDIEALMPYGLCIGTHHTNATGDRPRYSETRGVCVDECVNYNNDLYAELISDKLGIHVCGYMQRLVRKIKGDDKIILITDQTYANGPVPKGYEDATDIWFDNEGEISGSALTLNLACQNYMKHTGASLVDAFKVGSYNPARATGFTDRGEIAVGKKADLIFVDEKMNVSKVILNGEEVKL